MDSASKSRPLTNRTVLVSPNQSELRTALEALEARVIASPELQIGPPKSFVILDEAIENLYGYDWLIFANPQSAKYFLQRLQELERQIDDLDSLRISAIGETTALKLEAFHIHVDLITAQINSGPIFAELVRYLEGAGNLRRLNFLIPRGTSAHDRFAEMLEEAGARVDVVPAYRTVASGDAALTNLSTLLRGGGIDCVAFTSPASVNELAQLFDSNDLSEILEEVAIASSDEPTILAATEFGLKTAIQPTDATALAEAIATHFSR